MTENLRYYPSLGSLISGSASPTAAGKPVAADAVVDAFTSPQQSSEASKAYAEGYRSNGGVSLVRPAVTDLLNCGEVFVAMMYLARKAAKIAKACHNEESADATSARADKILASAELTKGAELTSAIVAIVAGVASCAAGVASLSKSVNTAAEVTRRLIMTQAIIMAVTGGGDSAAAYLKYLANLEDAAAKTQEGIKTEADHIKGTEHAMQKHLETLIGYVLNFYRELDEKDLGVLRTITS